MQRVNVIKNISFKNSRELTLIGTLWEAPSQSLIIMAHGSGSNKTAKGLFPKIAEVLQKENYNLLAFDFSGHGESDDAIFTLQNSVDDLASIMAFAKEKGFKNVAFFGHSLGAYACLANYSPMVKTMVLIGALTGPVQWRWEDICTPQQIKEMEKTGYMETPVNDGFRERLKIDINLLTDIQEINQKKLLQGVGCPLLLIHGDADQQERDLCGSSKKGIEYFPVGSQLKILTGVTHSLRSFFDTSDQAIKLIKQWLRDYFPID